MNYCLHCKHWHKNRDDDGSYSSYGDCHSKKVVEGSEWSVGQIDTPDYLKYWDYGKQDNADLIVGKYFGCIHFDKKTIA